MLQKRHLLLWLFCCFTSHVWCAASGDSSDDDDSSSGGVALATINEQGREEAGGDFHLVDVDGPGRVNSGPVVPDRVTVDGIMPFLDPVEHISESHRRELIQSVIDDYRARKPEKIWVVGTALNGYRQRSEQIRRGIEITIEKENVKPPIEWLAKKIIKKESEYLGRKVTREQKIKWITSIVSAIVAGGLTYGASALMAHLESLTGS